MRILCISCGGMLHQIHSGTRHFFGDIGNRKEFPALYMAEMPGSECHLKGRFLKVQFAGAVADDVIDLIQALRFFPERPCG